MIGEADKKGRSHCETVCLDVSLPRRVLRKPIVNRPWQAVISNMTLENLTWETCSVSRQRIYRG